MKKAVKISLIVLGCLLVLLIAAFLLVSPITKWYIEKHDKELIGRELTIGKLWVNVVSGTVKLEDVTLYEDDDKTPFVSFDHFDTRIKVWDLLNNQLWVKHALLSGLRVNIQQNRTWFNFDSMVQHFASDEPEEPSEPSNFGLIFNDITIEKSYLRYTDLDIGSEFNLHNIAIRIPFVDLSDLKTNVGLDLCLGESATLHTDLRLSENAEQYFIDLSLNNLGIDIIEPYLQQTLAVDSLQGRLDLDFSAQGRTEHILDFDLNGNLALSDLALQDTYGNALGHIDSIQAKIDRFNLSQNLLDVEQLYLSGLDMAYIVNADSTTNFDLFMGSVQHNDTTVFEKAIDTVAAEIDQVQEQKSLRINVEDLQIAHSRLRYEDHTLPETFRYEISDISIHSKQFSLDGNNTVQMQASLNQVGKLHLRWTGSLNGLENHDLTLLLSNVKVADFSPYVIQMFGYPLENGTLSFSSQNKIVNGNLEGINKLQLSSPKVGDKMKHVNATYDKVPLKLGFYLLTDKNNNVSIDLPISGNLNDPKFSYRKAILKVFTNLIVKVVTTPFRLLASDDDIQYITFDPLQPDFSAAEYTMIDDVVSTLYSQPNLSIVMEACINYEETVQQLCNIQLQRDYYLAEHPEVDSTGIDFLTNEAIRSIKLNDKGLCEYAVKYSEKEKLRSKKDVASVAYEVYHEKSEAFIPRLIQRKNALLSNYLLNVNGLKSQQVSVSIIDDTLLKTYDKDSRYELHVVTYGEFEDEP